MTNSDAPPNRAKRRLALEHLTAGEHKLSTRSAHYLRDVLRLTIGERVSVFDGAGHEAQATITSITTKEMHIEIGPVYEMPAHPIFLTIALATPKGDRACTAVEKLTEIGVSAIHWLECKRSVTVPRIGGSKHQRWQRIAHEAARQSQRCQIPEIAGPFHFNEYIASAPGLKLLAHPTGVPLSTAILPQGTQNKVLLLIGPEGGFTLEERDLAENANCSTIRFGHHVLRTETAAIIGAGIIMSNTLDTSPAVTTYS